MSNIVITQDNCQHYAKVKMPGYKDMYECTRCHKFISSVIPKDNKNRKKDDNAPGYLENEWDDD